MVDERPTNEAPTQAHPGSAGPGRALSRQASWTAVLAATSLWLATTVTLLVEVLLKAANPDEVDVASGLAYLQPVLVAGLVLVVMAASGTVGAIRLLHKAEGAASTRLPWLLLLAQAAVWLPFVLLRASLGPVVGT